MIRHAILAVLALTMLPVSSSAQTSLRWQFPVGRKLEIELTQKTKQVQGVSGQELTTDTSSTNFMTWEVASVDSETGVATINGEIDRMTMKMSSPQLSVEIDSASDKELQGVEKMVGDKLLAMIGKPFRQTMGEDGQVLAVAFAPGFEAAMGKVSVEKLIKNASPKFPLEPVSPGQSWDQQTTTPMPGQGAMLLNTTYTYRGKETVDEKELEVIDVDMKMTFETAENAEGQIEITEQKTDGEIYFDAANGHTTSINMVQTMSMDITFSGQKTNQKIENSTVGKFKITK